jgi:hypothetical protein
MTILGILVVIRILAGKNNSDKYKTAKIAVKNINIDLYFTLTKIFPIM